MNKSPWLIAGIVASGVAALASLRAAFPETAEQRRRIVDRIVSEGPSVASRAWEGVTDTFSYAATNAALMVMDVSDSIVSTVSDSYCSPSSDNGYCGYSDSSDSSSYSGSDC